MQLGAGWRQQTHQPSHRPAQGTRCLPAAWLRDCVTLVTMMSRSTPPPTPIHHTLSQPLAGTPRVCTVAWAFQLSSVYMVRLSNDDFYNSTSSFLSLFIPSLPLFQRNHAIFHQQEADILQIVRELTVDIKVASGSKRLGVPRWFLLVTPGDLRKRSIIETLCAKWNCYCLLIQML